MIYNKTCLYCGKTFNLMRYREYFSSYKEAGRLPVVTNNRMALVGEEDDTEFQLGG